VRGRSARPQGISAAAFDDESDPDSGYGWLCRLLDAGVLTAAGFRRVRKRELETFE
jgi:hypothetical protein